MVATILVRRGERYMNKLYMYLKAAGFYSIILKTLFSWKRFGTEGWRNKMLVQKKLNVFFLRSKWWSGHETALIWEKWALEDSGRVKYVCVCLIRSPFHKDSSCFCSGLRDGLMTEWIHLSLWLEGQMFGRRSEEAEATADCTGGLSWSKQKSCTAGRGITNLVACMDPEAV